MFFLKRLKKIPFKGTNIKNGIWFSFFSFLNNGVNFLLLMILADILSTNSYGALNLFQTTVLVLTVIIPLASITYVGVSFFQKTENDLAKIISAISIISISISIILLLMIFIGGQYIETILGFSRVFQCIAVFICLGQVFTTINLEIWRLQEKPIIYGVYSSGIILLNLLLTLLFVYKCKLDWEGRVYAQLIVTIIFSIISFIVLYSKSFFIFKKVDVKVIKESISFGAPLLPHAMSNWLRQGLDRYILNFFGSISTVGLFSFALNFGNIINMIGLAFNMANSVFIYKSLANETSHTKNNLLKQIYIMTGFFGLITVCVIIGAHIGIPYLFPSYIRAIPLLYPLCIGAFFQCVYYLFVNYLYFYKKTKSLMYITVSISICHFLLSLLFTRFSPLYTAYISLISNFTICLLTIIYCYKNNFLKSKIK